ncbi:hypothetical protein [Mucilaginibacter myungsuensis]|uniref:Uncharacterized protein n=1 Tax=Mucilaginibacter myungsuensis TaxID=649104 RepID=A0A929PW54_9SPHI|nr:hypothetical protein [Mucilaginibacter myungsuensis]MBE9661804.1 hypothetical protein [Mucilaginibacter myungsuensis]MDN3599762.1 hypothetical protein [Mucilaginibacter myungsuensis]
MITPENEIPLDDTNDNEADDQQSQKDIHSNGFDDTNEVLNNDDNSADVDRLQQADRASESAYTLNLDDEVPSDDK